LLERATGLPPRLLEAPRDRASIPAVLQDHKGYVHKLATSTGDRLKLFVFPQCILVPTAARPDGHCTVCYVQTWKVNEGLSILQRIGVDHTETVVMNCGLHTDRRIRSVTSRRYCRAGGSSVGPATAGARGWCGGRRPRSTGLAGAGSIVRLLRPSRVSRTRCRTTAITTSSTWR
jgi:hypothetical protein